MANLTTFMFPLFVVFSAIFLALNHWAWRERRPSVSKWDGWRRDRVFRADLYTDEGNRRRRFVVAWFFLTMVVFLAWAVVG